MTEKEIIRQLREQNEQLKREIELLKAKIRELEARLAQYENAHTPPSLRRGRRRNNENDNKGRFIFATTFTLDGLILFDFSLCGL